MLDKNIDIHQLRAAGLLSVRASNACKNAQLFTVADILDADVTSLKNMSNCGSKTVEEILRFQNSAALSKLKEGIQLSLDVRPEVPHENTRKCLERLDIHRRHELHDRIEAEYAKLSVRLRNAFPNFGDLDTILPVIYSPTRSVSLKIRNVGKKTIDEVNAYLDTMKHILESLTAHIDLNDIHVPDHHLEIAAATLRRKYPFLTAEECDEAAAFEDTTGRMPGLYIVKRLVERSDEHRIKICRDYYGLGPDGRRIAKEEIAVKYGIGTERVRQIKEYPVALPDSLRLFVSSHIEPPVGDLMPEDSTLWQQLADENMLADTPPRSIFALVAAVLPHHTLVKASDTSKEFVVRRDIIAEVKLRTVYTELMRVIQMKRTEKQRYDICEFISRSLTGPNPDAHRLAPLYSQCLENMENVESDPGGRYFTALPNTLRIPDAIEKVIAEAGRPLSFDELLDRYNRSYPEYAYSDPKKFRAHIFRNPNVRACGKSSKYILSQWTHHFTGTITEYIEFLIGQRGEPMHVDEITSEARKIFESTGKKSILSLIYADSARRFITFKGEFIGLASHGTRPGHLVEKHTARRIPFDLRFADFKKFVADNGRIPACRGSQHEHSLFRWMQNVLKGHIDTSETQFGQFTAFLDRHRHLPQTGIEFRFKSTCESIKGVIRQHGRIPSRVQNPGVYDWIRKYARTYQTFTDHRRHYFEDLMKFASEVNPDHSFEY